MVAGRVAPPWLALVALAGLGLGLRVWGIGFGLPETYHPDEPAYVLQALAVGRGLPGGLTFANPPLFKYLLLAEYGATYGLGRVAGRYTSAQEFVNQFRAQPTLLYIEARVTSAVLGSLTVVAVYALGATWRGRRAGLLAAAWTAVAFLLVRESHFGVNDALVALVVTLALVPCVRIARCGDSVRDSLLGGVLAGLAFTAKYQGLALLVPLVLAHLLAPPWPSVSRAGVALRGKPSSRSVGPLGLALVAMLVSIGLTFPSLVIEPRRVIDDIYLHLYLPGQLGYAGLDPSGGYAYYLRVLGLGIGWPILLLALAGLALRWRDPVWLVVASLPLTIYGVLGAERMYFARLLLPALPALVVLAAVLLDEMGRAWLPRWPMVVPLIAAVMAMPLLLDAVRLDRVLTQTDTRTEASEWAEASLPRGARVALDAPPLGPPLPSAQFDLLVANGWVLDDLPLDEYRARGVEYIVTSSFTADAPQLQPQRDAQRQAFYAALAAAAPVVADFEPASSDVPFVYDQIYGPFDDLAQLERPGPGIRVYALRAAPSGPASAGPISPAGNPSRAARW